MDNQENQLLITLQQKRRKSVIFWIKMVLYSSFFLFLCDGFIIFTLLYKQNSNLDELFWSVWFWTCILLWLLFYIISLLINAVVFIRWLYQSYKNLLLNEITLNYKPSMAIWWSIIPIINIIYPVLLMKELVQKLYQYLNMDPQWIKVNIYRWWWFLLWSWVLFKQSFNFPEDTFNNVLIWWILDLFWHLLLILSTILLLKIFNNLDAVEDKFLEKIKTDKSL